MWTWTELIFNPFSRIGYVDFFYSPTGNCVLSGFELFVIEKYYERNLVKFIETMEDK